MISEGDVDQLQASPFAIPVDGIAEIENSSRRYFLYPDTSRPGVIFRCVRLVADRFAIRNRVRVHGVLLSGSGTATSVRSRYRRFAGRWSRDSRVSGGPKIQRLRYPGQHLSFAL